MKSIQPLLFLFMQWMVLPASEAQTVTDTIFYDNHWRICEKAVAGYYRIGELKLEPRWHFINEVRDFYINGQAEMAGRYSPQGAKDGIFSFYHPNGKMKKSGAFANDTMKGVWSFYDAGGELYFQLNCEGNRLFTPLFIKNPSGDTLLKNGTGRFAFKLMDYPDVFPGALDIMVKGQCAQGKRTGEWMYDLFYGSDWRLFSTEVYEDGVFQKGKEFRTAIAGNQLQQPTSIAKLYMDKLTQTEAFACDIVFGESEGLAHPPQLTNFLLRGQVPAFGSQAKRFEDNIQDYLLLCAAAIGYGHSDTSKLFWNQGDLQSAKLNQNLWLLGYCVQTTNPRIEPQSDLFPVEKLKSYNAHIRFRLYEEGVTSDVAVKGNFGRDVMLHLAYYLSRLTRLAPRRESGKAMAAEQNLYVFSKANTATHRGHSYIVYRLLLSLKPPEQTVDRFNVADFAKERFDDEGY